MFFNVTLNTVRKALGESGRQPHYIFRVSGGYSFVAEVREKRTTPNDQSSIEQTAEPGNEVLIEQAPKEPPITKDSGVNRLSRSSALSWQVVIGSGLYALLYSIALVLEIAYQFDRFGASALKIAPLVFGWITISSAAGLVIDRKLTSQDRAGGLIAAAAIFLIAAAALFLFLTRYLPATPITESYLQVIPLRLLI
jgi:hypothetical protein